MIVYKLIHRCKLSHGWNETKMIGYFDSEKSCHDAIRSLLSMPGFRDHPDSFRMIDNRLPDIAEDHIPNTVYEVTSERIINATDSYVSFLGVYAHEASAQNRVAKSEKKIMNHKKKTVFYVEPFLINQVHWSEGFDSFDV